tara:strand:- start:149 stop:451 length:303 start_codon:yes stop_codon:yes gene_type:complete
MNLLFIISGLIIMSWGFTFRHPVQKNIIFELICYSCGGALILSVLQGPNVDWFSYIFFMALPFFIFIYLFFFTDWEGKDNRWDKLNEDDKKDLFDNKKSL